MEVSVTTGVGTNTTPNIETLSATDATRTSMTLHVMAITNGTIEEDIMRDHLCPHLIRVPPMSREP